MAKVSFTGSFLLKQPNKTAYEEFYEKVLPKSKRVVVPDVINTGNKLVTVKNCYDREIAEYLLKKSFDFVYYPNADLKRKFNPQDPKAAAEILGKEKKVIKDKEVIRAYAENLEYSKKPIEYRWEPDDHIDKTINALNLEKKDCIITNIDNILSIYDNKNCRLIAKASPNNDNGENFVYLYPTPSNTILAKISYDGRMDFYLCDKSSLEDFKWHFYNAVKIDKARQHPTKKV